MRPMVSNAVYACLVGLLLALAAAVRFPAPIAATGAPNLEASYHALLTITALDETPVATSKLLPIVSLGRPGDKGLAWGVTVPIAGGNYVYTSFGPPAFVLPWLAARAAGLPPRLETLVLFNLALQALSCGLLSVLLLKLLALRGVTGRRARFAALAGVSIQILSAEALLSFGLIYWAQQLFQPVAILFLIVLTRILERDARHCGGAVAALAVVAAVATWIEWTALVLNGATTLLLLLRARRERRYLPVAVAVAAATGLALFGMVAHFALAAGWEPALHAFGSRFLARSAATAHPVDFGPAYARSYGLLLVVVAGAALAIARRRGLRPDLYDVPAFDLAVAVLMMGENLLLIQHATEFSFDRLKACIPAAILLALAIGAADRRLAAAAGLLTAAALAQNVAAYRALLASHADWAAADRGNRRLVMRAVPLVRLDCATLASDLSVRGYANLLMHRGIHEKVTPAGFAALSDGAAARRCGALYLSGTSLYTDLPRYDRIVAVSPGGATRALRRDGR